MRLNTRSMRDDRGNRVHVPAHITFLQFRSDIVAEDVTRFYDSYARATESLRSRTMQIGLPVVMMVWFCFMLWLVFITIQESVVGGSAFIVAALAGLPGGLFYRRHLTGIIQRLERRRRYLPRLCPQCHYELAGMPVEPDGCTVCPECGGAWMLWPMHNGTDLMDEVLDDRGQAVYLRRPPDTVPNYMMKLRRRWFLWVEKRDRWSRFATTGYLRLFALLGFTSCAGFAVYHAVLRWEEMAERVPGQLNAPILLVISAVIFSVLGLLIGVFPSLIVRGLELVRPSVGGMCVGCMNDCTGCIAEPDGCVICPRCDAAWKFSAGECRRSRPVRAADRTPATGSAHRA